MTKSVIYATVIVLDGQPGLEQCIAGTAFRHQCFTDVVPALRGVANTKISGGHASQTTPLEVGYGHIGAAKLLPVNRLGTFQGLINALIHLHVTAAGLLSGHCKTHVFGKGFHRFHKFHALVLHQKRQRGSAFLAAKTMEKLFVRTHGKGWRFLVVEGAQARVVLTGLF